MTKTRKVKFVLTCCPDNAASLKGLIFATSYFLRHGVVKSRKLAQMQKFEEKHLQAFQEVVEAKKNIDIEDNLTSTGVLFLLGENEKLVQQQPPCLEVNDEPAVLDEDEKESLSFLKVLLPR